MASQKLLYKGVTIEVWEQSIRGGSSSNSFWMNRPIGSKDIEAVKSFIDAGRAAMAKEMRELDKQRDKLLGERR